MSPYDGRIDHEVLVLAIAQQLVKDLLPNPVRRPTAEALVQALVLSVALRKIVSVGTGTQNPQNSVHEKTIVSCSAANAFNPPRKNILNPFPLHIAQLVTTDPHKTRTTNPAQTAKSIC